MMKAPGNPSGEVSVMTVDDHQLMREGLAAVLTAEPGIRLLADASTGAEAIQRFRDLRPDVTLMDLRLPDMSGIEAMLEIRRDFPDARIVILTTYKGDVQVQRALKAGAAGYLLKSTMRNELIETVHRVHAGARHLPVDVASDIARHYLSDALSDREVDVLRLVAQGKSNKAVATTLNLTENTIKGHMKSIIAKLKANDRTHAVMIGLQRGIIEM